MQPIVLLHLQPLRTALEQGLGADHGRGKSSELPWSPGERVSAEVESVRPGGRMGLRIGEFIFDAPRPPGVNVGQRLQLQFASASPRPTFVFDSSPDRGAQLTSEVAISGAARQLDALLQSIVSTNKAAVERPTELVPLLPAPPTEAAPLAPALQRAIENSGLFYEAHLAKWLNGDYPLERIREEPQARLVSAGGNPSDSEARAVESDASPDVEDTVKSDSPARPGTALPSAAFPPVQKQLEALDVRQVLWQGTLWPGQTLQWQIGEPARQTGAEEGLPQWTSHLRITLPNLGSISP